MLALTSMRIMGTNGTFHQHVAQPDEEREYAEEDVEAPQLNAPESSEPC